MDDKSRASDGSGPPPTGQEPAAGCCAAPPAGGAGPRGSPAAGPAPPTGPSAPGNGSRPPVRPRGPATFVIIDRPAPRPCGPAPPPDRAATTPGRAPPGRPPARPAAPASVWSGTRRRRQELRFGEHAVRLGMLSRSEIDEALAAQRRLRDIPGSPALRLGELLLARGALRPEGWARLMRTAVPGEAPAGDRALTLERLGAILVEEELLSPQALREALIARHRAERTTGVRALLSSFLVEHQIVDARAVRHAEAILRRRTAFEQLVRQRRRERFVPPVEAFLRASLERSGLPPAELQRALAARDEAVEVLGRRLCLGEVLLVRGLVDADVYAALIERHLAERVAHGRPLPHAVRGLVERRVVLAEQALWVSDLLQGSSHRLPSAEAVIQGLADAGFIPQRLASAQVRRSSRARRGRRAAAALAAVLLLAGLLGLVARAWFAPPAPPPAAAEELAAQRARAAAAATAALEEMLERVRTHRGEQPLAPLAGDAEDGTRFRAMALPVGTRTYRVIAVGQHGEAVEVREVLAHAPRTAARRQLREMERSEVEARLQLQPLGPPSPPAPNPQQQAESRQAQPPAALEPAPR
ncbi:MAG: hypothetical protein KatS3mg102_0699 [Planctomycetota bacterium]|nr:MAG: hypothetical protein KatS3mg102_0699 [Planctomycetota bacterium]